MNRPFSQISPEMAQEAITKGTGKGIRIAILDSGVEANHPELNGLELIDDIAMDTSGMQYVPIPGQGVDVYGHGTAVAGVIRRMAPEAEIGSFRVLDEKNCSGRHVVAAAANIALEKGYDIINCSFGCRGEARFILSFKDWCDQAYLRGIHVVAACNNRHYDTPEWPSHFPSVISVNMAATESDDLFYRERCMVELAERGVSLKVPWKGQEVRRQTGSS